MLCQKCGKKEAVVHVVCMVNNKQIDKWLCADCAEKLMPFAVGAGGGRAIDARNLLETLFFGSEAAKAPELRRFTKRMSSILENAMRSALDRGHDHLGTEHLLLALLNEKDCYGIRVLEKLGVNPIAVAEELEKMMDPAGNLQIIIGYTPRAKRALEIAAETAAALKSPQVGSEHLLMGILREDKGMGGTVLRKFNITAEQVWQIIRSIREHQPAVPGFEEAEMPEYNPSEQEDETMEVLKKEKELVGMYLSAHPLDKYSFEIKTFTNCTLSEIPDLITKCDKEKASAKVFLAGYITNVQVLTSKSGSPWSKTVIEDFSGSYEFALFGRDHETFMPYLQMFSPVYIEGVIEEKYFVKPEDRKLKDNPPFVLKIKKISLLGNISGSLIKGFVINISTPMLSNDFRKKLVSVVKNNSGATPLSMYLYDPQTKYKIEFLSRKFRVAVSDPFINDLEDLNIKYSVIRK